MTFVATTGSVLLLMLYGWNGDRFFDQVCDLDREPYSPSVHEGLMTYLALSFCWLVLAFHRGRKLRMEMASREEAETRALGLARTDVLTGLLNRRAFMDELRAAVAMPGDGFVMVLLDVDDLRTINDLQGHASGDAALQSVGRRLAEAVGEGGLAARLGGDEFAALIRNAAPATPPHEAVERLTAGLRSPATSGATAGPRASIGAAIFPLDGGDAEALLQAADAAMSSARREGGDALRFFDPRLEAERGERRRREAELRSGIDGGEVRPFYQPIVRLADGGICGFEVLARWMHPRLGLLPPSEFIGLAEASGQITALTESLLRQACGDIGRLPASLRLAINVSPTQFSEPLLAERLIDIVRAAGVSASRVEIELTEDALIRDIDLAAAVIATFRASGMTIALDDFGTGFSGLSTLRRLRFDKLKIDRSFVGTVLESDESRKLVEAILHLARSFGLAVTAEGIEDEAVLEALSANGCEQGQGYLFGKPMPFESAARLVGQGLRPAA
ncbi:putative bifunctional diguanylate cyclase/phosphodiesterase [Lichenibacterium dinghuense]|uniref:putative bifunctional diguanylate cyclase/phosphodiesterase n=1 Tax=Lichenibacterium dinghuense TaxID=2895977 RepID=UPI001F27D441|nr:bifunctional diguanylate cyclase/phosphodiesterase [Lichenibacterium sp. 6Y81]